MEYKNICDLVSIIVPCYNGEKFVDRCLESIYIQEYSDIELIVVDDGSTDCSKELILSWKEKFLEKKWNLKYYYQDNKGLGGAINAGLKLVSGAYISLLDIDDEYLPGAIAERVTYLKSHKDVWVVRSNGWVVKGKCKYLFIYEQCEKDIDDIFLALLRGETNNWAGSYMVRANELFEFYPNREIYQSRYGQNLQILLPLLYKRKCGYIDKPHMNYIQQANSLSQTIDENAKEKKELENMNGYKDIRVYMLNLIVKDEIEKNEYLRNIEGAFWRNIMSIALVEKNKELMCKAYQQMKKFEKPRIDDKIKYTKLIFPYCSFVLRVTRKIRYIISVVLK